MLVLTDEQVEATKDGCPKCGSTCLLYVVTFTNIVIVDKDDIIDVHEGEDGTITRIECDDCDETLWEEKCEPSQ